MMRRKLTYALGLMLVVSTFAFSLWVNAESIGACECNESKSTEDRLNEASAVFLGRVVRMHFKNWPLEIDSADVPLDIPLTVDFIVRTVWKGEVSENMRLTTVRSVGCGYRFNMHLDYLVFADGEQGALEVRVCSHTKLTAEAQEDLDALGEGRAPEPSEKRVIRPATIGSGCNAGAENARAHTVSWPLGLIAGIAWIGVRKRRRRASSDP